MLLKLQKLLIISPKEKFLRTNRGLQCFESEPILFFGKEGEDILLPYAFATLTLGEKVPLHQACQVDLVFKGQLYEHQQHVVDEAVAELDKKGSFIIGMHTSAGKTVMGVWLGCHYKELVMVLVTRTHLLTQWDEAFKKFTGSDGCWIVGKPMPETIRVVISTVGMVSSLSLQLRQAVGTLIVDEVHMFYNQTSVAALKMIEPRRVIAESATIDKGNGLEEIVYCMCGHEGIFEQSTKKITVIAIHTNFTPPRTMNVMGVLDWTAMVTWLTENQDRQRFIADVVATLGQRKCLILTAQTEIPRTFPKELALRMSNKKVSSFYGSQTTYSDCDVLLGTIGKIGCGFDEQNFCKDWGGRRFDTVVMIDTYSSIHVLIQAIGRGERSDDPMVVHVIDNDKTVRHHWDVAVKYYKSRGCEIKELYQTVQTQLPE